MAEKAYILPPKSRMGAITDAERDQSIKGSLLYSKYANSYDPDSAYEFLMRRGLEAQAEAERAAAEEAALKEAEKQLKEQEKLEAAQKKEEERAEAARIKEEERAEAQRQKEVVA